MVLQIPRNRFTDFNIDRYLNPYIPHNRLDALPQPISHFLGYRAGPAKDPPAVFQWISTFFGTLGGICVMGAVLNCAPSVAKWEPPAAFASMGAAAILEYNAVRSPLAQPRNAIVGHTIAAVIGVSVCKLFMLNPALYAQYSWVAAGFACALASVVMSITGTVYPPGGATTILACATPEVVALGWLLPPLILLVSILLVSVACVINNIWRQYPIFWWSPETTGQKLRLRRSKVLEAYIQSESGATYFGHNLEKTGQRSYAVAADTGSVDAPIITSGDKAGYSSELEVSDELDVVEVGSYAIRLPSHVDLNSVEVQVLEGLMIRLRTHIELRGRVPRKLSS